MDVETPAVSAAEAFDVAGEATYVPTGGRLGPLSIFLTPPFAASPLFFFFLPSAPFVVEVVVVVVIVVVVVFVVTATSVIADFDALLAVRLTAAGGLARE